MKNFIVPALALAAVSVALPAAAQTRSPVLQISVGTTSYGHDYDRGHYDRNWSSINQRQAQLDRRIDVGVRNGSLSHREAARLRGEFNSLARLEAHYRRGGLTGWERTDLDRRFDRLSAQIRYERADYDRRDRYGRRY